MKLIFNEQKYELKVKEKLLAHLIKQLRTVDLESDEGDLCFTSLALFGPPIIITIRDEINNNRRSSRFYNQKLLITLGMISEDSPREVANAFHYLLNKYVPDTRREDIFLGINCFAGQCKDEELNKEFIVDAVYAVGHSGMGNSAQKFLLYLVDNSFDKISELFFISPNFSKCGLLRMFSMYVNQTVKYNKYKRIPIINLVIRHLDDPNKSWRTTAESLMPLIRDLCLKFPDKRDYLIHKAKQVGFELDW